MIGFYDSGIGGFTVLKELQKLWPKIPYLYYADTAVLPLGEKSINFIQNSVKKACQILFDLNCEIVILACNTASVNSIRHIQQVWLPHNFAQKKVLSITAPLLELLEKEFENENSKNKKGLILSTTATHTSGFYQYELLKRDFTNITSLPCQGLANKIEKLYPNAEQTDFDKTLKNYNQKKTALEEVVLTLQKNLTQIPYSTTEFKFVIPACTHYEWIADLLEQVFSNAKTLKPGIFTAQKIIEYLKNHPEIEISDGKSRIIYS